MLTDPRPALAEQSNFVSYLVGLAGLARAVHALATDGHPRPDPPRDADDFIHLLLGVASAGEAIEHLAESAQAQPAGTIVAAAPSSTNTRWLR
ncbi:MAG TPA: hypothetical protein VN327_17395 [Pseudonocardiaceae bacterium]|jgi:hypothetical protein|nr:hypothetical protein [Pseudonocardiaceae bacterium]